MPNSTSFKKNAKIQSKRRKATYRNASINFLQECRSIDRAVAKVSILSEQALLSNEAAARIKRLDKAISKEVNGLYLKAEAIGDALRMFFAEQGQLFTQIRNNPRVPTDDKIANLKRRCFASNAESMVRGTIVLLVNYTERCDKDIRDMVAANIDECDSMDKLIITGYDYEGCTLKEVLRYLACVRLAAITLETDAEDAMNSLKSLKARFVKELLD